MAMFLSNHRAHDALKQNRLYEMLSCDPDYIDAYGLCNSSTDDFRYNPTDILLRHSEDVLHCINLRINAQLFKDLRNLLIALLAGYAGKVGVLVARLGFTRKRGL